VALKKARIKDGGTRRDMVKGNFEFGGGGEMDINIAAEDRDKHVVLCADSTGVIQQAADQ
jgi:hypothetical protein